MQPDQGGSSAIVIDFFVCTPIKSSNELEITPVSRASRGGLVVSLEGTSKPLTFLLIYGGGGTEADLAIHSPIAARTRGPRS